MRRTQETPKTKAEELTDKVRPDEPTHAQTKAEELPDKVCPDEPTPPSIVPTMVEKRPACGTRTTPVPTTTRSGRIVRPPECFQ